MGNPKKHSIPFQPNHYGTQPRKANQNKGEKMAMKTDENPDYVPPKGK